MARGAHADPRRCSMPHAALACPPVSDSSTSFWWRLDRALALPEVEPTFPSPPARRPDSRDAAVGGTADEHVALPNAAADSACATSNTCLSQRGSSTTWYALLPPPPFAGLEQHRVPKLRPARRGRRARRQRLGAGDQRGRPPRPAPSPRPCRPSAPSRPREGPTKRGRSRRTAWPKAGFSARKP